jgi:hypothetical protein
MATNYYQQTITDGLVFSVDAANIKSYSGTGTTCFDLIDRTRPCSLISVVGYLTENLGCFDMTTEDNGRIEFPTTGLEFTPTDSFTMNVMALGIATTGDTLNSRLCGIFMRSSYDGSHGIDFGRNTAGVYNWGVGCRVSVGGVVTTVKRTFAPVPDQIEYITLVYTPTLQYVYRNGVIVGTNSTTVIATGTFNNNTEYGLGDNAPISGGGGNFIGKIYNASIYNRPLSAEEVAYNYTVLLNRLKN